MEVSFADGDLERLESDPEFNGGFSSNVVRKYRMRMQMIRAATDEREFYALKSLHFKKLQGKRSHQRSMKLNDQWRLVVEIKKGKQKNRIVVVSIEDYHKPKGG